MIDKDLVEDLFGWDELTYVREQYEIKCDQLLAEQLENKRLALILIKHGLSQELEVE